MVGLAVTFICLVYFYSRTSVMNDAENTKSAPTINSSTSVLASTNTLNHNSEIDLKVGDHEIKGSGPYAICIVATGLVLVGLAYIIAKIRT